MGVGEEDLSVNIRLSSRKIVNWTGTLADPGGVSVGHLLGDPGRVGGLSVGVFPTSVTEIDHYWVGR